MKLSGSWTMTSDAVVLQKPKGRIVYRFHARDVNLVMGADSAGAKFRVLVDGKAPTDAKGVDVDAEGMGVVREPRMYQLIRQSGTIVDRTVEIEFLEAGVRAYSFTFG